jgi:PIN domain nuclease of toxin-antitoxin system
MLNLDTHILIHALSGDLTKSERLLLRKHEWCISSIVLRELAVLRKRGRINWDLEAPEFLRVLNQIQQIPIDLDIALLSTRLDFKSDPADHLIAATSINSRIPLLTRDSVILKSKIVPLAIK